MAKQQQGVAVKSGNAFGQTVWALVAANKYMPVGGTIKARLQLTVAGSLSGLAAIDGITPAENDVILVSQGTPSTDGLYYAHAGAWTLIFLCSQLRSGVTVSVTEGGSAPTIFMATP
jgi:hypothetical protein